MSDETEAAPEAEDQEESPTETDAQQEQLPLWEEE